MKQDYKQDAISILKLLEEKRKEVITLIEKGFENYYKRNKKKYVKSISFLKRIKHPQYSSIEYKFSDKEAAKWLFMCYLYTDYSNPNWKNEGINILDIFSKINSTVEWSYELDKFNDWLYTEILKQNARNTFQGDYTYFLSHVYFGKKMNSILSSLNFNESSNIIQKIYESARDLKTNYDNIRARNIEITNYVMSKDKIYENSKHFNDKWRPYRNKWTKLKKEYRSVKEAFIALKNLFPKDSNLTTSTPEGFNRAMNKWLKTH